MKGNDISFQQNESSFVFSCNSLANQHKFNMIYSFYWSTVMRLGNFRTSIPLIHKAFLSPTSSPKAFNVHNQEELDKFLSYLTFLIVSLCFLKFPVSLIFL